MDWEGYALIYFTADNHFGHENVIRFCNRPFASADEMNEHMISAWNDRVRQNDTVFILGDMFFRAKDVETILSRLKGKKRLIIGNHDSWLKHIDSSRYFLSVDPFLEVSDGHHALTLCHYPMVTWKHALRSYMVHGHIHNDRSADFWPLLQVREHVLNAGVDVNGYCPATFDELVENNRRFKLADNITCSNDDVSKGVNHND